MSYSPDSLFASTSPEDQSLRRLTPFQFDHRSLDSTTYMATLGLFGTAGDPDKVPNWRAENMQRILQAMAEKGLEGSAGVFNPQKADWNPEDAAVEARHLARDASLVLPVLDITSGHASLAETGFAALGGTLRPQSVRMYIESGLGHVEKVERARSLTTMLAEKTLRDFPVNAKLATSMQEMLDGGIEDVADFVNRSAGRIKRDTSYTVERRTDLDSRIALVGSGADNYIDSWYSGLSNTLDDYGVNHEEIFTAYKDDWDIDDAKEELAHKTNDAVVLFVVEKNQSSFGAMGELGWLMSYCSLNGQKLGVYVEPHDSDPKSDENRQRKLAMSHTGRHLRDFPDLPVFIASSPKELALYGASELAKYKQLQHAVR